MSLTGYGAHAALHFDGNEEKYELWECRFLSYMRIKKLKKAISPDGPAVSTEEKEDAFAELVQHIDERSLALIMRDAKDDGRKALKILRNHYAGYGKPRVLSMFRKLTSLQMEEDEDLTGYLIRAENMVTALKQAGEKFSDNLLIAAVLKGLPAQYEPFDVYINQTTRDKKINFLDFKMMIRNFEENNKSKGDIKSNITVMKVQHGAQNRESQDESNEKRVNRGDERQSRPNIKCYNCGGEGHKANECPSPPKASKKSVWCNLCESSKHSYSSCKNRITDESSDEEDCRKKSHAKTIFHQANDQEDKAADGKFHSFAFSVKETEKEKKKKDMGSITNRKIGYSDLLVDSGSTVHIINDKSRFDRFEPDSQSEEHSLDLADGTKITGTVRGIGTATVMIRDEHGRNCRSTLSNVLYCPTFPYNIFSVNAATKRCKGTRVTFGADSGTLYASGTSFPIQNRNGLYFLLK